MEQTHYFSHIPSKISLSTLIKQVTTMANFSVFFHRVYLVFSFWNFYFFAIVTTARFLIFCVSISPSNNPK